ncbi:hypothetical protein OPV22_019125 [Ensete ventricosum]|uniref:14-3-3 domain-containing protein n=1 Tax=Ensete ventricosum TaxID=4639 RepID=A0AAV8PGX3_ENSVE|nr:hypothetical protein OPV22_019125 [Ensete ventricosum]
MASQEERQRLLFMAKVAEQAHRYDEMANSMRKLAHLDVELTTEEKRLLSAAYKEVTAARRDSWRILSSIDDEDAKAKGRCVGVIREYRRKVEAELASICNDVLAMVDDHLIPSSSGPESSIFYHKMKADYYRYLAESKTGNEKKDIADKSLKVYQAATKVAEKELSPTNPIRLGLALNLSVFYYEIIGSPERAFQVAHQAFDEAISGIDLMDAEEPCKDSTLILRLLKDNFTLWISDVNKFID